MPDDRLDSFRPPDGTKSQSRSRLGDRRGFTLVEVLVAIVIASTLAKIAVVKAAGYRERALRATMVSDMRNMVSAQEAFYSANRDYAGSITPGPMVNALGGKGSTSLAPSGANKITVTYKSATGWSSTATNAGITKGWQHCGVFIGVLANSPNSNVKIEGTPGCW